MAAAPALAAPIVPGGAPVTVSLPVAGDIATLTFSANAGDRVSLEITGVTIGTSVCCSTKVTILRPDNKTLSSLTLGTNGGFIDAVSLPLSGTYSIVVDPQSTNVGDATLTLHAVPPDTTSTITLGGAPVTVGSTAPGQNATASFAGTVGEIVSLEISDVTVGTSTCCSTKVSLIRPDGRVLATTTVGTNGGFLDAVALPLAGAYSIVVDPQGTLTGGATLLLHDVPPDATAAGALGSTTSIATTVPGQNARVTFAGIAGGRVSVEITDVTVGTSFCCSTKVTLLRPDARVVSTATFGTNGGFLDAAVLAQTGMYAVVVDPQGSATGAVTITLHDVPADASGTVAFGSSAPVTTTVPGQNANVTFSGVAGQRASVVVSDVSFGTSTCCSLRISILKPNGSVLVTPVSVGSNGGFLDAVVLPTTGTYTLFVDPQGPVTGSATLTLYNVPADAAATIVPGGAPATVSTTVPGQNAGVTFDAVSNQKVSVKVGPSCCATRVSIIKPNGAVLVAAMTLGAGGGFMDTVTIPTTGTYTILVDLQGPATGDVTLTLYDVPADVTGTIAFGVPKTVTTTVPGQNASLTFTGTAGQVVSLVMAGGCCTTRISLLKPNGTVLVSPVSFGAAGGFLDATTLPNNGTYTIAIDPQGAATGALTFTLHTVPAEATGTLSFGLPASFATTVPGQNIRLTFAGTAGHRVSFRLDPSCCTTRISLLRPDGSVAAAVTSFGTSPAFLDPVSLTTTGTYTVLLDPQGSSVGAMTRRSTTSRPTSRAHLVRNAGRREPAGAGPERAPHLRRHSRTGRQRRAQQRHDRKLGHQRHDDFGLETGRKRAGFPQRRNGWRIPRCCGAASDGDVYGARRPARRQHGWDHRRARAGSRRRRGLDRFRRAAHGDDDRLRSECARLLHRNGRSAGQPSGERELLPVADLDPPARRLCARSACDFRPGRRLYRHADADADRNAHDPD